MHECDHPMWDRSRRENGKWLDCGQKPSCPNQTIVQWFGGLCWLLKNTKTVENRGPSKFFELILEEKHGMGKNGMEACEIWIFMAQLFTFTPQCAHYCTILHAKKYWSKSPTPMRAMMMWFNETIQPDSRTLLFDGFANPSHGKYEYRRGEKAFCKIFPIHYPLQIISSNNLN